jgi:hypothetical protein
MRVKLFTFRYSATLGGFDDSALQQFARDREVVAFTCVLTYQDAVVPPEILESAREVPGHRTLTGRCSR